MLLKWPKKLKKIIAAYLKGLSKYRKNGTFLFRISFFGVRDNYIFESKVIMS